HEADRTDRTVAAASILAKSERERFISKIKIECGVDFGSGYCHDKRTLAYLKAAPLHGTACVRWTWATARSLTSARR
ncbi:MAG TPA: ribonuclease HII, partial [Candidatus Methylomirabilis sp.]|nr:ribonuclease HII [Candidatus Methylomirabilis sp.]